MGTYATAWSQEAQNVMGAGDVNPLGLFKTRAMSAFPRQDDREPRVT